MRYATMRDLSLRELENMAQTLKADSLVLIDHNRDEALKLFRLWRRIREEITKRRSMLAPAGHTWN